MKTDVFSNLQLGNVNFTNIAQVLNTESKKEDYFFRKTIFHMDFVKFDDCKTFERLHSFFVKNFKNKQLR